MLNDLDVIVKQFPNTAAWNTVRLYAIGDVHVGSESFDERAIRKKISIIKDDPYGLVSLCGDLGDFGLKSSVTNPLRATLQPREQIQFIYELFEPIKDKIVSAVPGNHEDRLVREIGTNSPLYDLCVRWGCPDVFRENAAILKLLFGTLRGNEQQNCFIIVTTHGSSRTRHRKFTGSFDGVDAFISGHTHEPSYNPMGRISVDAIHAKAKWNPCKSIVVDAHLAPGGYGLKKEYEVPPPPELQYLELTTKRDTDKNRTTRKVMDYHSITI